MRGKRDDQALDPLMEGYLEYLADVGRKQPRTVVDVRCTLKRVGRVFDAGSEVVPLWERPLTDFLRWIEGERQRGRSGRTLAKNISHVRGFLDYAWRSGRSERNVLDGFRLKETGCAEEPASLSLEEAERLLRSCGHATKRERRDRMIVLLFYGCGLRTQELCGLKINDVDQERRQLLIRLGKGDQERIVPLPEVVHTHLLAYLLERRSKRGWLFRGAGRGPLAAREACRVVREAAQRADIGWPVTPRTLRHSYATHLMDRGVDLALVSRLMGHRSPRETGVYLHALQGRTRQAVDRLAQRSRSVDDGGDSSVP